MRTSLHQYLIDNREKNLEELLSWLKIPSISTLSEHRKDVKNAAEWAEKKLQEIGFPEVELIEGEGHPLVYAQWLTDNNQPTLLFYGHYDVQPADPLNEWHTPPFQPYIDKDNIYARGATDDKGQVMIVLAALEAWVKSEGKLPVNVKVLLEGEEEAGGASVEAFVREYGDRLTADAALICDTHMNSVDQPSLIIGLRGILYTEIIVKGAKRDLHSGSYGGVAPNPIHALCLLLSRLKGENGRIDIPGIYVSSVPVSDEEKDFWHRDAEALEKRLLKEMGVEQLVGEKHVSVHGRLGIRPTLEVHGIRGGFIGEGAKTVIPAEALAKVSLRLPAGSRPTEVFKQLEHAVQQKMPKGYTVVVRNLHSGDGVAVSPENRYINAAAEAIAEIYGVRPVFMREGGSIPITALFDSILHIPVVLMGFGLSDDGAHGPNEKFSLNQFYKGMDTVADFLGRLRN
ncbi:MAG: dipeptidase [Desulfocapsaceae bacterium]|nr:dipeptidase [Desulfocapsaceae bacterium]